jgi:Fe-S cluster assembly ATPase SufC
MAKEKETIKIDVVEEMKRLMDDVYKDTYKLFLNENISAGKRARKNSHTLKTMVLGFRKLILDEIKRDK